MRNYPRTLTVLGSTIVLLLLSTLCVYSPNWWNAWRPRPETTRAATATQLQSFLLNNHVQPLIVEDIGKAATVVLFRERDQMGYYILYDNPRSIFQDDDGIGYTLVSTEEFAEKERSMQTPVSVLASIYLQYEIVGFTINDPQLIEDAYKVKVIFVDGTEAVEPVQAGGGVVALAKTTFLKSSYTAVILYDRNGKQIFTKTP